jgi:hypothetical protein
MSKIHIGPHTRPEEPDPHPAAGTFDREINLRGIFYTVAALLAVALVVHLLIWGLLKGFTSFDARREPPSRIPSPLAEANKQPPPPGPQLQTTPELDLLKMRREEDQKLGGAGWIDQGQGTVRVPIDVAMEVIAGRGLGPEVVGGTPGGFPQTPQTPTAPGALVQMSRQPAQANTQVNTQVNTAQPQATPPQERR